MIMSGRSPGGQQQQQEVPISERVQSTAASAPRQRTKSMRSPRGRLVPSDEPVNEQLIGDAGLRKRRRRRRQQCPDLAAGALSDVGAAPSPGHTNATGGYLRRCASASATNNNRALIVPLLYLVLLTLNQSISIYCKPNSSNQHNGNSINNDNQLQLTDKQLLRKALDSSESSRAQAIGGAISQATTTSSLSSVGGESGSSTTSSASSRQSPAERQANSNELTGTSSVQFQCPEQFGYYTDTKDCTKYYVCVFGEVLHESCTGGLRFSRELQTCDWPRNVECPNGQNGNQTAAAAATTTATTTTATNSDIVTTASALTTTATPATTTTTTSSSTSTTQQSSSSTGASSSPSTPSARSANSIQDGRPKAGASLVFADENSDPQQPSFDEAISPVITADGAIHLHDGSGGTFALGPNPNRALAQSAPQSINGPVEAGGLSGGQAAPPNERNVDVFVMPLSLGSSAQQRGQPANKQQRARFQQQSGAASQQQQPRMVADKQQQQQQTHHLQAASLPAATSQHQRHHHLQTQPSANRNAAELNDESGDFNLNGSSSSTTSNGAQGQSEPELGSSGGGSSSSDSGEADDGSGEQADGPQGGHSPGTAASNGQADRELDDSLGALDNNGPAGDNLDQDQFVANNQNGDYSDDSSSGQPQQPASSNSYIPPVLTSPADDNSNNEHFSSRQPPVSAPLQAPSSNHNNRQRQQQSSPLLSVNNRQIVDPTRQTFKPIFAPGNQNTQPAGPNNRHQPPAQLQANGQSSNQNPRGTFQQQQQQFANANSRQNNQQQLQQLQNNNAQNNRQSRMSSQFSANANPSSPAPSNPLLVPASPPPRQSTLSSAAPQVGGGSSRFPPPTGDRHQQQQSPQNDAGNRVGGPQQALTPTFQPRFPQQQPPRSQSTLLFSAQKPGLGFMSTPAGPFFSSTSAADQLAANQTARAAGPFRQDQGQNSNRRQPSNDFHQIFSNSQQQQQQQQQQQPQQQPRRSRPPKRQQIPSGSPPAASSRQRPAGNGPLDFDTTTTTMSTPAQLLSRDRTSTTLATGGDTDDDTDNRRQQRPPIGPAAGSAFEAELQTGPPTRAQLRPASAPVSPTTVNFRDSSSAATFPTTSQPQASPSPPQAAGSRQRLTANGSGQSARSGHSLAPGLVDQLANGRSIATGGDFSQPPLTTTTAVTSVGDGGAGHQLTTSDAPAQTQPAAGDGAAGAAVTQPTVDPQAAANRYLSSAIDALEAGQPFGTVDYDFDFLNDNSTDRRAPAGGQNRTQQPAARPGSGRPRQSGGRQPSGAQSTAAAPSAPATPPAPLQQQQPTPSAISSSSTTPQVAGQPTKKPRPTNKKIVVNHEQALANIRASVEPAKRPEPLFSTPQPLQQATKCDNRVCRLPDCKCGDTLAPGNMDPKLIPQVVLLTFDDAVNDLNWEIYEELFSGRTNPNGCPILATFYVSHEWTDYGQVQTLYSRGHEMASHSVTHSFGEKFSKSQWFKEINGQREILNMYGGVKMNDVRGMRAPFLQIGGNKMFEMLYDANFTYDSSMPIFENSPPMWPYTLDYQLAHECMITPCPTKSFPGVWEVGMTMWVDLRGGRCSMGDACSNPTDEDGVYEMLMKNFNRHYKSNRAPFGLFYHSAWFNTVHHRRGFLRFMNTVNSLPDVFFVTNWQMLQWMRQPTPISEINSFEPWQCPAKNDRPPPCYHPSVCNVKSEHGKYSNCRLESWPSMNGPPPPLRSLDRCEMNGSFRGVRKARFMAPKVSSRPKRNAEY
jgi:hypothetical protein